MIFKYKTDTQHGFTLVELMVGIAVVAILATIALPSLSRFSVGLKVDGEISELHRLILIARNVAVNSGNNTIICPIVSSACSNQWDEELSVFEDVDTSGDFSAGDTIIKVKSAIAENDQLVFSAATPMIYTPRGNLAVINVQTSFTYCPSGYTDENKGVIVSPLGRPSVSRDSDSDGFDEDRAGVILTCS